MTFIISCHCCVELWKNTIYFFVLVPWQWNSQSWCSKAFSWHPGWVGHWQSPVCLSPYSVSTADK